MAVLDRVTVDEARLNDRALIPDPWFKDLPVIKQLRRDGMRLGNGVTGLVGGNGSGKSTCVAAVAVRWGESLTAQVKHWRPENSDEDALLHRALVLSGERPRPQGGCFLRAEAMHEHFTAIDRGVGPLAGASRAFGGRLNIRSHGESFLAFLESLLSERGLFVLDEPEAALSFTSCLRLLAILGLAVDGGSQVVLATHSPVLAAMPGATIVEIGEHGFRTVTWDELELVGHWRSFMARPDGYLRHLFAQ